MRKNGVPAGRLADQKGGVGKTMTCVNLGIGLARAGKKVLLVEAMLGQYRLLLQDERNREPLKTLKVYLENNMNFSITAEKMYVHINTIRKRIDKVKELLDVSLDDRIARLKLEMLLQFLNS